jgi:hypothetical protein
LFSIFNYFVCTFTVCNCFCLSFDAFLLLSYYNNKPNQMIKKENQNGIGSMLLIPAIALCFAGCSRQLNAHEKDAALLADEAVVTPLVEPGDIGNDIMCTNNLNNQLEVFNYGDANWNDAGSLRWSWMPTTARGYTSTEVGLWTGGDPTGDPMDAKRVLTNVWSDCSEVMVTVGGQLATIVKYATTGTRGDRIWARNCGAGSYPHAAELIPNGNIAVAASHGDWVKVFSTTTTNVATYSLPGAHGVVWDYDIQRLWVVGDTKLTALIVGGTRGTPTLTEDVARAKTIPGNGHDLSIFTGDNNKLWVTNSGSVYVYDKTTKTLTNAPGAAYRSAVKAVSNNNAASGYMIVETKPNTSTCTLNTWCTPSVDFYNSSGTFLVSRTRTGAAYYKGDVWWHTEQPAPAAPIANGKYVITSVLSGKAAVVQGASMDNSAKITTWPYTETNDNDEWNITQIGTSGYYRISNEKSGLDMNVQGASYDNSTDIIQYAYAGTAPNNDEWKITSLGGGEYKIESRYSGKCLNVQGAATADGTQVIQYPFSNVAQSKWTITTIP